MRSSLHPALFAAAYRVAAQLADLCGLTLSAKAELLLATPKVAQAVCAALLDCYTWKLAEIVYGRGSRTALTTVCCPFVIPYPYFEYLMRQHVSLQYRYAARGSGSAQLGHCPIVLKPPLPQLPSTTGLGIGWALQETEKRKSRVDLQLRPK